MTRRRAYIPAVIDRLEDRVALSHATAASVVMIPTATAPQPALVLHLQGTVKGFEIPNPMASPLAGGLLLRGTGTVTPLGSVSLIGTLSIRGGEPTFYDGRVTLSTAHGGIVVHIHGIQGGPSGPPAHLLYDIVSGWGVDRGATGHGTVIYSQSHPTAARTMFSLTFGKPTPTATS